MGSLDGRIAWVTGAGTGMGLAGAQHLAAAGATVVMSGRRGDVLEREAAGIRNEGGKAEVEALDVSDAPSAQRVMGAILRRLASRPSASAVATLPTSAIDARPTMP